MKRTRELLDRLGIDVPVVLAPMAGNSTPELVAAVSNAGGLGSYGCAMLSNEQLAEECTRIRSLTNRSFNLNFFCHAPPNVTAEHDQAWRSKLAPYYAEFDIEPGASAGGARRPFDEETCDAVLAIGPRVVSFHFGMPKPELVQRLKAAGMVLMSSATASTEARRLVNLAPTSSSRKVLRRAAIAACSSRPTLAHRSEPWRWFRRWSTRSMCP